MELGIDHRCAGSVVVGNDFEKSSRYRASDVGKIPVIVENFYNLSWKKGKPKNLKLPHGIKVFLATYVEVARCMLCPKNHGNVPSETFMQLSLEQLFELFVNKHTSI